MTSPKGFRKKKTPPKRKKVVIDYPEVPTRTWVPPDARRKAVIKPPQARYQKPEGIDQKLAISSLKKMWHFFEIIGNKAVLPGSISQNHKKFHLKTRGFQAPANAIIAITFSQLYEMPRWKTHYIDKILGIGDSLYMDSRRHSRDPHKEVISLSSVYKTFYIGNEKITIDIKKEGVLKGPATLSSIEEFGNVVRNFFQKEYSCVLVYQGKYYALWNQSNSFYLFDPYECDKEGHPWTGLPNQGVACLMKYLALGVIVNHIISCSLTENVSKGEYSLTPVYIQRIVQVNTKYPDCMKDANLEVKPPPDKDILQADGKQRGKPEKVEQAPPEKEDEESEEDTGSVNVGETAPGDAETVYTDYESRADTASRKMAQMQKEKKVPLPQKQEADPILYYIDVVPGRMSILRAPSHQCNPNFSKYLGQQSYGNAFSVIAMLHIFKSKLWTNKTMEDILKQAEQIHHDSLKTITGDHRMKVTDVCRKITCEGLEFTPKVEEYSAVGRLNSDKEQVSDLTTALREVLSDDDACIITGPLIVAFWSQGDEFFMWDPNERDEKGVNVLKEVLLNSAMYECWLNEEKAGSFIRRCNSPGFGCVTCYKYLKDMVAIYMINVPRVSKRDQFILSKVQMEDFNDETADWFNFKALKADKWILCGSFNQSDVRFSSSLRNTQCTSMAAMFLAYAVLTNIKEWSTEQIDEILVSGNDYYGLCVNTLKESGKFTNRLLMASELLPQFMIGNKKMIMNLEELAVYGTLSKAKNVSGFGLPFKQGLKQFFEGSDYGILTCCNLSVAIFKFEDGYFVADSHSRSDRGYVTHYGTAVVIRHMTTDELATSLETNYGGSRDPTYNIHRVAYETWDAKDDGEVKPPLNNFTAVNDYVAILRGLTSEDCPTRFPLTFGKQHVPMGLAILGMIKLTPPATWTVNILDEVLNVGNKYYKRCIEEFYKENQKQRADDDIEMVEPDEDQNRNENMPSQPEQTDSVRFQDGEEDVGSEAIYDEAHSDAITSNNVLQDFTIGINKFTLDLENPTSGVIVDLPDAIQFFFQQPDVEDNDQHDLLVETNPLTVVLWRDNGLYYYFDPKPRDETGHVYGKDEWTLISPEELALLSEKYEHLDDELYEGGEDEQGTGESIEIKQNEENPDVQFVSAEDGAEEERIIEEEVKAAETAQEEADAVEEAAANMPGMAEGEDDANPMEEEINLPPKHTSSYWKRREIDGMACVMWFTELEHLVNHVIENIPPRQRGQRFRLISVKMQNEILSKDVYDPELGPKETKNDGNWHNFKEVTHGHWILRGTSNLRDIIYPIGNRGRQYIAICFAAAAFVRLFALSKFVNKTVDTIIKYGDKLHTSTRRVHKTAIETNQRKEEKRVCAMTKEELDAILNLEQMDVSSMVKKFCIGEHCVTISVMENLLEGEIFQDNPDILTLENALDGFFGSAGLYAILQTKGVHLFITKYHGAYFVFDPDCRGPSAHKSTSGDACFTRHSDLDMMCSLIVSNLPVEGSNAFYIHSLDLQVEPCQRIVKIEEVAPSPLKISGFNTIFPGKYIISGTTSIEPDYYGRLQKQHAAPVNMVALAMTLIHRCENWTKVIVDEIVRIGYELYKEMIESQTECYEQNMSLFLAPTDFKIGSIQVSSEIRNNDQRGIVDIKSSRVQNLRRGLEIFFDENTHGIISTYDLMIAVWKPEGQNRIYMFDGSSRGKAGMPMPTGGGACMLGFDTPKLVADHFTALTPEFGRRGAYIIVPVEIVVARAGRKNLTKKAVASKQERELLAQHRRKEQQKLYHKARHVFYELHAERLAILRADRSQNSKYYSKNSRGLQDLPNCVMAYVMDKMLPVVKWTYSILHNILDIGDQLYKDSVVMFAPKDPKLGVEALQRVVITSSCMVKLAVGKPIMSNNFNIENVIKALEVFFGSRNFCILNVAENWLGLFKKNAQFYMFDPQDIDMHGNRMDQFGEGNAAIMRFDQLELMVEHMVRNLRCDYSVFSLNLIAVKDVVKLKK